MSRWRGRDGEIKVRYMLFGWAVLWGIWLFAIIQIVNHT